MIWRLTALALGCGLLLWVTLALPEDGGYGWAALYLLAVIAAAAGVLVVADGLIRR